MSNRVYNLFKLQKRGIFKPLNMDVAHKYKNLTPKNVKSAYRPRTINDIEKVQKYIQTSNSTNSLEE